MVLRKPGLSPSEAAFTFLGQENTGLIQVHSQITHMADHGDALSRYKQKADSYIKKNREYIQNHEVESRNEKSRLSMARKRNTEDHTNIKNRALEI